jgi:energy-converting hydrogenase B subunit D
MTILGVGLLAVIAICAFAIVRTDDVTHQLLGLAFYGLIFGLLFFVLQAPDVALSQITVGAIALPLLIMLAITRMKHSKALADREKQHHD